MTTNRIIRTLPQSGGLARGRGAGQSSYAPVPRPGSKDRPLRTFATMVTTTTRTTLLTPSTGKRVRVVRIKVRQETAETAQLVELYFGTGTNAATTASKIIDILSVPNGGEVTTRSYDALADGPVGLVNEVVSYRWRSAPTNAHLAEIEYLEE